MKKLLALGLVLILSLSLFGCTTPFGNPEKSTPDIKQTGEKFPDFVGKDFDGNDVDQSIFADHDLTVVNFWFNGCPVCVVEMPGLEKLNTQLGEKNAAVIGVNVEAPAGESFLNNAKHILSEQNATYKNIYITGNEEAINFISQIYGYPTSFLVDKNGNIIGNPLVGRIDDEKTVESILKIVDEL